jgi:hypothetical protein
MPFDQAEGLKYITAWDLEKILRTLPEDTRLIPNKVGNLLVYKDGQSLGYIDILEGEFERWS